MWSRSVIGRQGTVFSSIAAGILPIVFPLMESKKLINIAAAPSAAMTTPRDSTFREISIFSGQSTPSASRAPPANQFQSYGKCRADSKRGLPPENMTLPGNDWTSPSTYDTSGL